MQLIGGGMAQHMLATGNSSGSAPVATSGDRGCLGMGAAGNETPVLPGKGKGKGKGRGRGRGDAEAKETKVKKGLLLLACKDVI